MHDLSDLIGMRKRLMLTQKQLAKASGVSQSLIAKIESGLTDPSFSKTKRIFQALEEIGNSKGIKARDVMNPHIISVSPDDDIKKTIGKMKKHGISQLPVMDNKMILGMVSESLLLEALMDKKPAETRIKEIMSSSPPSLGPNTGIATVTGVMKFYSLILVVQDKRLLGVITKSDLLDKL
jgi:predicted transcriptional regulator